MMENIIEVSNFSKSFGKIKAIKNVSFEIKKWEIFAYLWTNGSWKTTTIRALLNIYKADFWTLKIKGEQFNEGLYNKIWYLPEERWLYLDDKVWDVLLYFAELKWLKWAEAKIAIEKYLKKVWLEDKINTKIKKLSSGQQQKIQFWLAILHNPEIIILDEPMKGLDPLNRQLFIDMILEEKEKWSTILFSSHQMEDVEKLTDSVLILKNWEVWVYGKLEEVKKKHWKNSIKIYYEWKFPKEEKLFNISSFNNSYVELTANSWIDEQKILKFLLKNDLIINKFEISALSLNDIFISINKN